jgi:hypothetical protein
MYKHTELTRDELTAITGGICETTKVSHCYGVEAVTSGISFREWSISYHPQVIFEDYCVKITDVSSLTIDLFRKSSHFSLGKMVDEQCEGLTAFTGPNHFQGITKSMARFFTEKKTVIEQSIHAGEAFSICAAEHQRNWHGARIFDYKIEGDQTDGHYVIGIIPQGSDTISHFYYHVVDNKEVCQTL